MSGCGSSLKLGPVTARSYATTVTRTVRLGLSRDARRASCNLGGINVERDRPWLYTPTYMHRASKHTVVHTTSLLGLLIYDVVWGLLIK